MFQNFEKRKQSRFMRFKSKVSVGECSEGSFEFETETGKTINHLFIEYVSNSLHKVIIHWLK